FDGCQSSEAGSVVRYSGGRYGSTPNTPMGTVAAEAGRPLASTSTIIRACPRPCPLTSHQLVKMNREGFLQIHESRSGTKASCPSQRAHRRIEGPDRSPDVKYTLDTGQPSEMAESMLHALEESLSAFEKHRELVLDRLKH